MLLASGMVFAFLTGCATSSAGVEDTIITLTYPKIAIREDGLARCRVEDEWRREKDELHVERNYIIQSNRSRAQALRQKLQALSALHHPELIPGDGSVIRTFEDGTLLSQFNIAYPVLELHPFWEGVIDEAKHLVHYDLLWALFLRDEAEWRGSQGHYQMACYSYELAVLRALDATSRLVLESEYWIIDDRELLLTEPRMLEYKEKYKEAFAVWRQAWIIILSGDVRLVPHNDGAVEVVVRNQDYQRLLYRQDDLSWHRVMDDLEDAKELYNLLSTEYEQRVADYPNNFDDRLCLMWVRYNWASHLAAKGFENDADILFNKVQLAVHQLKPHPHDPVALFELSWFLSRCADPRFRDTKRALALAERAVHVAPREVGCWRSLGSARYAIGDYEGAILAYDRADELTPDHYGAYASFYAGLACLQLERRDEALHRFTETNELLKSKGYDHSTDRHWRQARDALAAKLGLTAPRVVEVKTVSPPRSWHGSPLVAMPELNPSRPLDRSSAESQAP